MTDILTNNPDCKRVLLRMHVASPIMNDTATTAVRLSVSFLALVIYGVPERLDALNDNVSVSYGGEKTSVIFEIGAA